MLTQANIWHWHSSKKIQSLLHSIVHVESTIALTGRGKFGLVYCFILFFNVISLK